jgi:hypothetical protein
MIVLKRLQPIPLLQVAERVPEESPSLEEIAAEVHSFASRSDSDMAKVRIVVDTNVYVSGLLWTGLPHDLLRRRNRPSYPCDHTCDY